MPFDLLARPTLYIPVKFAGLVRGEDGGAVAVEHEVEIEVELLDATAMAEWYVSGETVVEDETPTGKAARNLASFMQVARNWRGVVSGGRSVPFAESSVAQLLATPNFTEAFGLAYYAAFKGRAETRTGNSEGSPANGQQGEPTDATLKA